MSNQIQFTQAFIREALSALLTESDKPKLFEVALATTVPSNPEKLDGWTYNEVKSNGYERVELNLKLWRNSGSPGIIENVVTFTNTSLDNGAGWPTVKYMFVVAETSNGEEVVMWSELRDERKLLSGDSLTLYIPIQI